MYRREISASCGALSLDSLVKEYTTIGIFLSVIIFMFFLNKLLIKHTNSQRPMTSKLHFYIMDSVLQLKSRQILHNENIIKMSKHQILRNLHNENETEMSKHIGDRSLLIA